MDRYVIDSRIGVYKVVGPRITKKKGARADGKSGVRARAYYTMECTRCGSRSLQTVDNAKKTSVGCNRCKYKVELAGALLDLQELCALSGITRPLAWKRMEQGMTLEQALFTPKQHQRVKGYDKHAKIKRCSACKADLDVEQFHACRSKPDGRWNICKDCRALRRKKKKSSL